MARRNAEQRFRNALELHYSGVRPALENAGRLLDSADAASAVSHAGASFLASMAAEEVGKGALLLQRAQTLLHNAEVRLHARLFHDDPQWLDWQGLLRPQTSWEVFAGRKGTHRGGLHDHKAKLQALRDYYAERLRIVKVEGNNAVLASIDIFQGRQVDDIRRLVERALYVSWDGVQKHWCEPDACIPLVPEFTAAMRDIVGELTKTTDDCRERTENVLHYVVRAASAGSVPLHEILNV